MIDSHVWTPCSPKAGGCLSGRCSGNAGSGSGLFDAAVVQAASFSSAATRSLWLSTSVVITPAGQSCEVRPSLTCQRRARPVGTLGRRGEWASVGRSAPAARLRAQPGGGRGGDAPRQPGPRDGKPGPTGSARASHRRRKKPGHRARSSAPGAMPRPGRFMAEGGRPSGVSHESPAAPPSPERGLSATGSFVRHFSVRAVQGLPAVTRQTARASCIAAICSGE